MTGYAGMDDDGLYAVAKGVRGKGEKNSLGKWPPLHATALPSYRVSNLLKPVFMEQVSEHHRHPQAKKPVKRRSESKNKKGSC